MYRIRGTDRYFATFTRAIDWLEREHGVLTFTRYGVADGPGPNGTTEYYRITNEKSFFPFVELYVDVS